MPWCLASVLIGISLMAHGRGIFSYAICTRASSLVNVFHGLRSTFQMGCSLFPSLFPPPSPPALLPTLPPPPFSSLPLLSPPHPSSPPSLSPPPFPLLGFLLLFLPSYLLLPLPLFPLPFSIFLFFFICLQCC